MEGDGFQDMMLSLRLVGFGSAVKNPAGGELAEGSVLLLMSALLSQLRKSSRSKFID